MAQEVELGRLAVVDPSGISAEIILTNLRVYQNSDGGIFGHSVTVFPYNAITAIRIGWRRAFWILLTGLILLALGLFSVVIDVQALLFPRQPSYPSHAATYLYFGRYLILALSAGLLLLFWIWRRSEIRIMTSTAAIGGRPANHAEGQRFCDLLLSIMNEPGRERALEETPPKKERAEEDWRL